MSEERNAPKASKPIADRIQEWIDVGVQAVAELFAPPPALVPVPARGRRRDRR